MLATGTKVFIKKNIPNELQSPICVAPAMKQFLGKSMTIKGVINHFYGFDIKAYIMCEDIGLIQGHADMLNGHTGFIWLPEWIDYKIGAKLL